jgi:hypothetical protein
MLERSQKAGVKSMIITGGSLHESKEALRLAQTHGEPPNIIRGSLIYTAEKDFMPLLGAIPRVPKSSISIGVGQRLTYKP